jgi:hypothetical protein
MPFQRLLFDVHVGINFQVHKTETANYGESNCYPEKFSVHRKIFYQIYQTNAYQLAKIITKIKYNFQFTWISTTNGQMNGLNAPHPLELVAAGNHENSKVLMDVRLQLLSCRPGHCRPNRRRQCEWPKNRNVSDFASNQK